MSRRRYRYSPELKEVVEISPDWTDAERRAPVVTEELVYGNAGTATDGTPLNSRSKHREYMKQNGLAMASDYAQQWEKASKQHDDFYAGRHEHKGLREAIGRTLEQQRRKR